MNRKPFQGVLNIIRFNWHFYVFALLVCAVLLFVKAIAPEQYVFWIHLLLALTVTPLFISLVVSWYVYDFSKLYHLTWLRPSITNVSLLNVNAGFDETSYILQRKFPEAKIMALDFYDQKRHTEVSIKRARKALAIFPNTIEAHPQELPLADKSVDLITAFLSAHEIRNHSERVSFFNELSRILHDDGQITVTEHLRDLPNFFAYNIGVNHFQSRSTWLKTFSQAKLEVVEESKITPFITIFTLQKNGTAF